MKNTIMKSYLKKILRSEAFVSVIIVFVLALGIIGTSYALYMDVDTDTDYQLVKSGDLSISFEDGSNIVTLDQMTPLEDEDVINGTQKPSTYTFSILNTGTYNALYDIKLELLTGSTVEKKDIKFLLCKETCAEKTVEDIKTLDELEDMLIHSDKILKDSETSDTYVIKVWLSSDYVGDTERNLQLKIIVEARNESIELKSLNDTIMNDKRIVKNNTQPTFTGVETNEVGMYKAPDDYGDSWYFRGKQPYNYVNFAGFTWRIVRINGDGSIRLILDGTLDKVYRKNKDGTISETPAGSASAFNFTSGDNAYVGYMYGEFTGNSTSYDSAHENIKNSTIKEEIDLFYETYIENEKNNYHFEKYLADTLFCGDKTLANTNIGSDNMATGFGNGSTNQTNYATTERLYYSNGTTSITTANPTLECASNEYETNKNLTEEQRAYSRYTSKKDMSTTTTKGVLVNNDLNYPIALLSADELVMAGGWGGSGTNKNESYYLYDAYANRTLTSYWWTMSPNDFNGSNANEFISSATNYSLRSNSVYIDNVGVRPVINLKADSLVSGGEGTYERPYTIKEIG